VTGLGLALLALGLADLVAGGISGEPRSAGRVAVAASVAGLTCVAGIISGLTRWNAGIVLTTLVLGAAIAWLSLRCKASGSTARASWALGSLGVSLFAALGLSFLWSDPVPGWLTRWLSGLPFA
jgi:hypothetical protein